MIRAVVDTNVLISALIRPQGAVAPLVDLLRDGRYLYLYTDELLDELSAKLALPRIRDKYHLTLEDIDILLALLLLRGEPVILRRRVRICRDPRDDTLLATASEGQADYLVSGDQDLLVLEEFEGIPIVPPARFLAILKASSS